MSGEPVTSVLVVGVLGNKQRGLVCKRKWIGYNC